ncbi:MAG: molybdopterin molybdotransferase MoeA [Sphingomonadales bacterium]|nr:molybdopterin molybdotransferase MoeA [Sphingomonadales bacterium]
MIAFDEALAKLLLHARALGRESVPIEHAAGRILAAPVIAAIDSPRGDVSMMDGYAVRTSDLGHSPARLRVAGRSLPGDAPPGAIAPGSCLRIFTGAPVPANADRIVIQEEVTRDGDDAVVIEAQDGASFIRRAGSDFRCGDTLIAAGTRLGARALVTAAGGDRADFVVARRPRIAIIATGDELVAPGAAARDAGRIPDSITPGVAAMAREWGGDLVARARHGDDLGALEHAAKASLDGADLVIVSGGASVGERDHAKAMFEPHGLDLVFSKVAMRPGKPIWLGRVGSCLVLGLPGNPSSAMVTARLFMAPLVAGLAGHDPGAALAWRDIELAAPIAANGARESFVRARIDGDRVMPIGNQDSGVQGALATADLLLRRPPGDPPRPAGAPIAALDF